MADTATIARNEGIAPGRQNQLACEIVGPLGHKVHVCDVGVSSDL